MGLDMYLTQRHYVENWNHMAEEEKHHITITKGDKPVDIDTERITYIITEECYWRKANAIHKWFVDNVQDGEDDCGEYYVTREQLQELLNTVNQVLATSKLQIDMVKNGSHADSETGGVLVPNWEIGKAIADPSIADESLPTQSGFFFGGTDYDQYYYDNLEHTKTELERILSKEGSGSFYYHSSW